LAVWMQEVRKGTVRVPVWALRPCGLYDRLRGTCVVKCAYVAICVESVITPSAVVSLAKGEWRLSDRKWQSVTPGRPLAINYYYQNTACF
jgi:hypothetical protein